MRFRATQSLLVGVALAALVAAGGRYSVHYFDRQAAKAAVVRTEFDACVKRFYAAALDPSNTKGASTALEQLLEETAHGAHIPCPSDGLAAADASAEANQKLLSACRTLVTKSGCRGAAGVFRTAVLAIPFAPSS